MKKLLGKFSSGSDLLRSISSGYFLFFLTNVIALVLTPFILRYVTKDEYGFYVLCIEFFAWLGFVNLGTAKVLGPKVSKELTNNNTKEIIYLFNSSFWFQLGTSLLTIPLYYLVVNISGAEKSGLDNWPFLVAILSLAAFFQNFTGQFGEMIIATRKVYKDNLISTLITLGRFVLILVLLPFTSIEIIFYIYLLLAVVNFARKYRQVKKLYPYLIISIKMFSKDHFKKLLSKGLPFTMAGLATILISKFDQFFLGSEFDLAMVAKYYITIKLILITEKLLNVFFNNFRPHIASFNTAENAQKIKSLYVELSLIALALVTLAFTFLCLVNGLFVNWWVGDGFYITADFTELFALYVMINVVSLPSRMLLVSTLTYLWQSSLYYFVQGIFRVALLYGLYQTLGMNTIPVSSLIAALIFGLGIHLFYSARYFKVKKEINNHNLWVFTIFSVASVVIIYTQSFWIVSTILFVGLMVMIALFYRKKDFELIQLLKGK